MQCHDAIERFSDYLEGYLGDEERTGLSVHLEGCVSCRREWDFFQRAVSLVGLVDEVEAPPGFAARVLEKTQRRPWLNRFFERLFFPLHVKVPLEAGALLLIAFGAALLYRGSPPLQKEIQAPGPPHVQAPRHGSGQAPPEARPPAKPPAPLEREQKTKGKVPAPASSEAPDCPRADVAQEAAPLAKAAPPSELAAKRVLEPSLDAIIVLRVSDIPLAAAGLQERMARFGGREADEVQKLKDRPPRGHPGMVKSVPGGRKEDVQEKTSVDLVLSRGAYPAFKASLPELGELSIEQEAPEGGPPRETIRVRVTILPAIR